MKGMRRKRSMSWHMDAFQCGSWNNNSLAVPSTGGHSSGCCRRLYVSVLRYHACRI